MKQSTAAGLTIFSVTAAIAFLIAMLVLFLTNLNIYGTIDAFPIDEILPILLFALGFLFFLALMVLFMIMGAEEEYTPPKPLLLEEPAVRSDAPISLEERLAHEVSFCFNHNVDISLLLMYFPANTESYEKKLRSFFDASSFIYPHRRNQIGVIIPFHDIKSSMKEVRNCFQQYRIEISAHEKPCFGGLTSRAGRSASPETILHEAEVSLERAIAEDASCVMCFHADPVKFDRAQSL